MLSVLKDFNFKGKIYSVKPYLQYFVRSNQAVGLRFDYSRGIADLGGLSVDFDDDLNFSLRDISYYQQSLGVSAFYRNYVGLDHNGRFGIFNEVDLSFGSGSSRFKRSYNSVPRDTKTLITKASLNFSPVSVFSYRTIFRSMCRSVFSACTTGMRSRAPTVWKKVPAIHRELISVSIFSISTLA